MLRAITIVLVAAVASGSGPRVVSAAPAAIYNLGIANNGSVMSRGLSINDQGQVAVNSVMVLGQGTAQIFSDVPDADSKLIDLGALPGDQTSFANAINAGGQIAGYSQGATVFTPAHAFRYDGTPGAGGVMHSLGTLGGASSRALGINDLGQVTGQSETDPNSANSGSYAFVYTGTPGNGGQMQSLGSLGGKRSSGAAINNQGQVVGQSLLPGGETHAFLYDGAPGSGHMLDLGVVPGYSDSGASDINSSGQIVGTVDSADSSRPFIYRGAPGINGTMKVLPSLPGGSFAFAVSINDAGFVLGSSSRLGDEFFIPTLWRPDGVAIDLEEWFNSANPLQAKQWNFHDAFITGINNQGLITGDAIYLPDDGSRAFILDASSLMSVPEPGVGAILAGAIAALVWSGSPMRRSARVN